MKYQEFSLTHNDLLQRWIIVFSEDAHARAEESLKVKVKKEFELIEKELFHLQAQRFSCAEDGRNEILKKSKKWKYHLLGQRKVYFARKLLFLRNEYFGIRTEF